MTPGPDPETGERAEEVAHRLAEELDPGLDKDTDMMTITSMDEPGNRTIRVMRFPELRRGSVLAPVRHRVRRQAVHSEVVNLQSLRPFNLMTITLTGM
jgi:hypothetical protein